MRSWLWTKNHLKKKVILLAYNLLYYISYWVENDKIFGMFFFESERLDFLQSIGQFYASLVC